MLQSAVLMALRELRRNLTRSLLTALGVVIGVAAVIAMVALGEGATAYVTDQVSSMGRNLLIVRPGMVQGPQGVGENSTPLELEDAAAIEAEVPNVRALAPTSVKGVRLVYGNENWSTMLTGTTPAFFDVRERVIQDGRMFTETEVNNGTLVCIIGETIQTELFGSQDPLGASVRVNSTNCTIIGVLEALGDSTFGGDQDDLVVMPIRAFQRRISGNDDVGAILVSATLPEHTAGVQRDTEELMRQRRRIHEGQEDDFGVNDLKEMAKMLSSITGVLTLLLGGIAAVSLLVGGIGIMNIMLVSVTERTREIGIRLAIGARGREVLLQFLVEAVVLSTIGGVIGILLGIGGAYAASYFMGIPFIVPPEIVIISFLFSSVIGIVFGFFPARKAARLNPIEALRYE